MGQTIVTEGQAGDGFILQDSVGRHAKEIKQLAALSYTEFVNTLEEVNKL